jgi:DNA-binding MarR family transcriptional regulator
MEKIKKILRNKDLKGTEKLLLVLIAVEDEARFGSNSKLSEALGVTITNIINTIQSLNNRGLVEVKYEKKEQQYLSREIIVL